jgi:hypothetical protein
MASQELSLQAGQQSLLVLQNRWFVMVYFGMGAAVHVDGHHHQDLIVLQQWSGEAGFCCAASSETTSEMSNVRNGATSMHASLLSKDQSLLILCETSLQLPVPEHPGVGNLAAENQQQLN